MAKVRAGWSSGRFASWPVAGFRGLGSFSMAAVPLSSVPLVPALDAGPVPNQWGVRQSEERADPHTLPYAAQRKHKGLYPPTNPFFILPVRFSKDVFQHPFFTRNNEKFDQHNENDGKCKGDQCSHQYCDTQED